MQGTKRRRFLQAAGAAGAVGVSGCLGLFGGGGDGGGDGDVEYWTLFGGGDGETMKAMVDEINEGHEFTVNRQRVPFDEYYDRLYTSMTGGETPDLAVVHADRMEEYKDLLEPLGDAIGTDGYLDSVAQNGVVDGEQLAVPLDTHPYGLYYNKDLFEEAGLDPESPPNSPEAFEEAASAIAENTDHWGAQYHSGFFHLAVFDMFLESRGGRLLDDDWSAAFDGEDGLAAAEFLNGIVNENGWVPQDSDTGWEAWQRGEAGMLFDGTWHIGVVRDLDFEWGMAKPFVMPGSDEPKTWANSHMLAIPRNEGRSDEARENAIETIRLLTQDHNTRWGTDAGHLPASQEALDSDELRNSDTWDQTLSTYYEMASDGQLAYLPATTKNGEYQGEIFQQLDDMRLGNIGPEEAIQTAAENVDGVFE